MNWLPLNLAHVDDEYRPEPTVGGIAYPGSRILVSGEPESLKSWLAAVLAVERIRAGEAVVWVDFEQGAAMTRERFLELGLSLDQLGLLYYIAPREPLSDAGRAQLVDDVANARPTLAVVDAYAGLLGVHDLEPNSERDIERVNRLVVDVFRDAGSTVAILDHVVKAKDNRSRYSSGNGRKLAEVEVHIGMERAKHFTRGTTGAARLRNHKDRLGGLPHPLIGELHLASDPATHAVTWEIRPPVPTSTPAETFRPTGLMEKVSRYLEFQVEPISRKSIEENVRGKGEYVRLAIDALIADGYAEPSDGPRGAKLVERIRNYREDDLVPTSSPAETSDLVPDLVPLTLGNNGHPDLVPPRPDLVPTSSPDTPERPRPSCPPPY